MSNPTGRDPLVDVALQSLSQLPLWILSEVSERIKAFNDEDPSQVTTAQVAELIDKLTYAYFVLPIPLPTNSVLYRGRPCGDGETYPRWQCIHYPPDPSKIGAGRANAPESAVLYCSDAHETVFAELRLKEAECINIAKVEVADPRGCLFTVIGEIQQIMKFGRGSFELPRFDETVKSIMSAVSPRTAMAIQYVDAFFADRFQRKANTSQDRAAEYKITAAIVNELSKSNVLDAVAYRSAEHLGGINWAFNTTSADSKLRYTGFEGIQIIEAFGYGMYDAGRYALAMAPEASGQILWERPDKAPTPA